MQLDLTSLKKAISSLSKAIRIADEIDEKRRDEREVIIAGVIQNFEFTYELCWKFMKRWLELNTGDTTLDGAPRRQLFRRAAEAGLIDEIEKWMEYHYARNLTSHTYNCSEAEKVFEISKKFIIDAERLLFILESKND
ncbi:MAG: nucleotidyltransferase substrate binding protein [Brevinematia bacterium]